MDKFEYKTEEFELKKRLFGSAEINTKKLDDLMNKFGADGWELVSYTPVAEIYGRSDSLLLVFKREIEE